VLTACTVGCKVLYIRKANREGQCHDHHNDAAAPSGRRGHWSRRRYTIDLDVLSPMAARLAEIAGSNNFLSGEGRLKLRSTISRRDMLADMSPTHAANKIAECEAYGIDLDAPDTMVWSSWSPYDPNRWAPEAWLEYTATQIPQGYGPVGFAF